METKTSLLTNSMNQSRMRLAFLLIPLALTCFGLSPQARALCQEFCNDSLANTFLGTSAGANNTTGNNNTAVGFFALNFNSTGNDNTANGVQALASNSTGNDNTANGVQALSSNTTGNFNTATGFAALVLNDAGTANTANGAYALYSNEIGNYNTATGQGSLFSNTGSNNTASGSNALFYNTTGGSNIALGDSAGINLTTGSNNIDIGNKGKAGESQYIRIGTKGTHTHTLIAGISGVTVAGGVGVIIDTNGKLGTVVSSERFKDEIKPMDKASEAILALEPVTFRYKHELDPKGIPQFGLVAEQVAKVDPELVARDSDGKPYSVRYEAVNAMLLNEFLKEHRTVEQQETKIIALQSADSQQKTIIAQQKKGFEQAIAQQEEEIKALTTHLQKVSNELELMRAGPRVVTTSR